MFVWNGPRQTEDIKAALDRRDVLAVERIARQQGGLSLHGAMALLELYAVKGSPKLGPASVRWLRRFLDEHPHTRVDTIISIGAAFDHLQRGETHLAATMLRECIGAAAADEFL